MRKNQCGDLRHQRKVDLVESVETEKVEVTGSVTSDKQVEVKEVSRIRVHAQNKDGVKGMVVYNQRVYIVHSTGLIVYCYTPDGSLSYNYDHKGGANADISGMCLIAALLVANKALVWIKLSDDITMDHHHTQHLYYNPWGSYNDRGALLVWDPDSHNIHRYRHDGQTRAVIKLPDDVWPKWVARHGDSYHYVVADWDNQV